MTNAEKNKITESLSVLLKKYEGRKRDALLPVLHEAQTLYGWLPREVQQVIGETLQVPLSEIHGVIEFYSMFYNRPTGKRVVRVCEDIACHLAGGDDLIHALEENLGLSNGETDPTADITLEYVPCLGLCEHAPAALNGTSPAGRLSAQDVPRFLEGTISEPMPLVYGNTLFCLARVGKINPESLSEYEGSGGYNVLREIVNLKPEEINESIGASGILGRGGAMFPLGHKWRLLRESESETKYIVINADESEPGTFKDRTLIEGDPFAVLEAATVAAYVVGAERGWIFVRGEYPRCISRLESAIKKARTAGYLGEDILGVKGFNFDIELRVGAGAYICGEETSLFEAIEGKRGFPRMKPPFPTSHGLFNQPTAINNVETLVSGLAALNMGIDKWKEYGTQYSPGTKLFCLSGRINKPGLYEVPFGTTIRELILLADGVPEGRNIQAILLGGAAGSFISPDHLNMPLTYEDARANGLPLGSGVIMVFDETDDLKQVVYQISRFFAHESCGKCFPCQLGTQRQKEILSRIANNGDSKPTDRRDLLDIGFTMTQTSLCGLGQTAASAVLSAIKLWPELFE